jgi:hypothetical protein
MTSHIPSDFVSLAAVRLSEIESDLVRVEMIPIKLRKGVHAILKGLGFSKNNSTTLRVLTTFPRSGTHWLKSMLSSVMGVAPLERRLLELSELISALTSEASRRLIYDHFDYDLHSSILDPNVYQGLRIVLLFRDPRDTLISNFYRRGSMDLLPDPNLNALENLKLFLRGYFHDNPDVPAPVRESRLFSMSYRDYVRRCAVDWIKSGRVFPLRYEDLIEEPARYLALALDHLHISYSPETVAEAVARNSFEVLSGGRPPGAVDTDSHYRRGVPGEWRGVFDREDRQILHDQIGDYLEFLGYPLE